MPAGKFSKKRVPGGDQTDKARYAAAMLTYTVAAEGSFGNLASEKIFDETGLSPLDRAFASAVYKGTISRVVNLDAVIASVSGRSISQIDPFVLAVLRNAVWQIMYSEKIPDHSAVDEAVDLASVFTGKWAGSYVNAVLRNITAHKEELSNIYVLHPKSHSLRCSMPPEIAGYFKKWFGAERSISICDALHQNAEISIRINTLKSDKASVIEKLKTAGIDIFPSHFIADAAIIRTNGKPVHTLPGFREGEFTVQDEAAMLVSFIASPSAGSLVADLCAAPGGKTCHLGEIMKDHGSIMAFDLNLSRIKLIEDNMDRLGISIIKCTTADAREIGIQLLDGYPADLVLADVPCSSLGIIRRKPDIMFGMDHNKIIDLYPIQKDILSNAAGLVKPGGYLVYSTCTLNPEENEKCIGNFIDDMKGRFEPVDFYGSIPEGILKEDELVAEGAKKGMITLFPDKHGCDGFFIAKLRRIV